MNSPTGFEPEWKEAIVYCYAYPNDNSGNGFFFNFLRSQFDNHNIITLHTGQCDDNLYYLVTAQASVNAFLIQDFRWNSQPLTNFSYEIFCRV